MLCKFPESLKQNLLNSNTVLPKNIHFIDNLLISLTNAFLFGAVFIVMSQHCCLILSKQIKVIFQYQDYSIYWIKERRSTCDFNYLYIRNFNEWNMSTFLLRYIYSVYLFWILVYFSLISYCLIKNAFIESNIVQSLPNK